MLYRQLWDKAHEAYKTQALATIILSSILIMTLLAFGCAEAESGSTLKPKGFRTSKSLSGGGFGNSYNPNEEGKVFLVITVAVPTKELIPTEAEYLTLKSEYDADKIESKTHMSPLSPRENCRIYNPERFTIILADGRGYHGKLIALVNGFAAFASSFTSWHTPEDKKSPNETVDVAFVVDEKDVKPPFRIQIDRQSPVAVPEKKMEK